MTCKEEKSVFVPSKKKKKKAIKAVRRGREKEAGGKMHNEINTESRERKQTQEIHTLKEQFTQK